MTIFCLGASLSCAKYLSLSSKEEDTTTTKKKTQTRKKGKNTNRMVAVIFFASKKPLSGCSFRVLSCKKNNLVCKLSSLSSSQSLGSERHATRRRQRRRRKRKTLRFVVVIPVAFFFSSHEKRRNFCCIEREGKFLCATSESDVYLIRAIESKLLRANTTHN